MDHLPPVTQPHRPVQVPYLGGTYDGAVFASFPAKHNWDIDRLHRGDLQGRTRDKAATFLQAWLYFGLLQHLLETPVIIDDFVQRDEDGLQFITTKDLPRYMREWKVRITAYTPDKLAAYRKRVIELLEYSHNQWLPFQINQFCRGTANPLSPEVSLSMQILVSTFEHSTWHRDTCNIGVTDLPWRKRRNAFVEQRMKEQGWCPTIIEESRFGAKPAWLYYISLLGPPKGRHDHMICEAKGRGCLARNVVESQYVVRHVAEGCKCEMVGPNVIDLAAILRWNKTPLLRIGRQHGRIVLTVVPYHEGMEYTAISHIWSDGLGNPRANTLPACQIHELADRLADLPPFPGGETEPAPLFWMDTLCVPVRREFSDFRQIAIRHMAAVYSQCSRVLVLDKDLMSSTSVADSSEIFSRISMSSWIRRVWTLQEGVLARHLFFQFHNQAVYIHPEAPIFLAKDAEQTENFWNEVGWNADDFNFEWNTTPHFSMSFRICYAWQALRDRTTSKNLDEPICLATLLGVEPQYINQLLGQPEYEARMKHWWSLHRPELANPGHHPLAIDSARQEPGIPTCVLWLPCRRLTVEGYRWAPYSVLDCSNVSWPEESMARLYPDSEPTRGLAAQVDGVLFRAPRTARNEALTLTLEGGTVYVRQNPRYGNPSWNGLELHKLQQLGVLLGREPAGKAKLISTYLAALVEVLGKEDDEKRGTMIVVRYLRMVSVIPKGSYHGQYSTRLWSKVEEEEKVMESLEAKFVLKGRYLVT